MSSVHAVTEDIQFEAKIASFYQLDEAAMKDILEAIGRVLREQGKNHDFLVWRVQMISKK